MECLLLLKTVNKASWTPEQRNVGQIIALPSVSLYYPTFLIAYVKPQVEDS